MTFANPLPGWAIVLVIVAAALVAWLAYRQVPISTRRRHALSTLRLVTLLWLIFCLMRPVTRASEDTARCDRADPGRRLAQHGTC